MNPLLQVNEQDIERLDEYQFADVLNRLLKAEAHRYGIPPLAIKTTLRIHDPDSGVDARVEHSVNVPDICRIPKGLSVWQYKTGDITPKDIKEKEAQKPGVQETIQVGGSYCFATGRGYVDRPRKNREEAINNCYREKGLTPRGQLLTAQDIADWVSGYPAVAMLPYFNRPRHDDLLTFDNWNNLHELRVGYVDFEIDEQRQTVIDQLGVTITNQSEFTHIRIVGRAGIGKTRLALEAIRTNKLEHDTLYALSPEGIPPDLFSYVEANDNIRLILVVDECTTFEEALRLQNRAQRCGARLLLITIGHEDSTTLEIKTEFPLFWLDALDDEAIRRIIQQIAPPTMPSELASFIIRGSGGYVKLATAITESLARNPNLIGASQLTGVPNVRSILQALVPDQADRRAMEAVSLLRYVGLDGDVATQGQILAKFIGMDFRELKRIVEQMRQRGVVVKRGRYRYVTPHLLAVWFAIEVWRARGEDIVNELLLAEDGLPTFAAKEALLERLADLGEEEIAAPVVERLLGPNGLFPTLQELDHPTRSRIFATLAKAAPKTGAATLQRLLGHLPRDELFEFRVGRLQVVWVLERMLSLKETFWIAARLLLKLAEAENETIANNATGIWRNIFLTHLGGTPIPALERHRLIKEALNSPQIETRLLAVSAIQTALSTFESRLRNSGMGGYIPSTAWRPETWGALREVRRSALKLLGQALNDTEPQVIETAKKVLLTVTRGLVKQGLAAEVLFMLEDLSLFTDSERQEMRELLQGILLYEEDALTEQQRESIKRWINTLTDNSFRDRLRRWVGKVSTVDHQELHESGKSSEDMAALMAEEGYKNPTELRSELNWLASPEAVHFYFFGRRLGELDSKHEWLEELIIQMRQGGNPGLLTAYLQGRTDFGEREWVEQLLDTWAKNNQEMAFAVFDATWRRGGSDHSVGRIISLVDKGWLPPLILGQLIWGGWVYSVSANALAALLQRIIQDESAEATETALALLLGWLKNHPQPTEKLTEYALELLERPCALNSQGMFAFYWEQIAKFYTPRFPVRIAQAILNFFINSNLFTIAQDKQMAVLKDALLSNPQAVWPLIGEVLLRRDEAGYRLMLALEELGIQEVGTSLLLEWAEKYKPQSTHILARIALVGDDPLAPLPRELLIRYQKDRTVGRLLLNNYLSGLIVGSEAAWLEGKLSLARRWQNDEHPNIRSWAQEVVVNIEDRIKRARQEEEKQELIWQ